MSLLGLQRHRLHQGLIVGFVLALMALVFLCPNLPSGCFSHSHQTCQDSTCVFLTLRGVVTVLIVHTWLVWTPLFTWSHDDPLRLFRPPRPRLLSNVS
jgi:hypothetical protein